MQSGILIIVILAIVLFIIGYVWGDEKRNGQANDSAIEDYLSDSLMRAVKGRRGYYRDVYLKSDAWKRKRYVVLKRDNWRCVQCGSRATQVHHKRYAKKIGKEPIGWLISVCKTCHDTLHQ